MIHVMVQNNIGVHFSVTQWYTVVVFFNYKLHFEQIKCSTKSEHIKAHEA